MPVIVGQKHVKQKNNRSQVLTRSLEHSLCRLVAGDVKGLGTFGILDDFGGVVVVTIDIFCVDKVNRIACSDCRLGWAWLVHWSTASRHYWAVRKQRVALVPSLPSPPCCSGVCRSRCPVFTSCWACEVLPFLWELVQENQHPHSSDCVECESIQIKELQSTKKLRPQALFGKRSL